MKIQALVAAVALAFAGGAFAADTTSTTTTTTTEKSSSVAGEVKADAKAATHKVKKMAHKAKRKAVHAARDARDSTHRMGAAHHAGMSHMEMSRHMNAGPHGSMSGGMGTDMNMDSADRKARMDAAYENWKRTNG